jgi:hypothetical protein
VKKSKVRPYMVKLSSPQWVKKFCTLYQILLKVPVSYGRWVIHEGFTPFQEVLGWVISFYLDLKHTARNLVQIRSE